MQRVMLVGLAGLLGTLARFWLSGLVARRHGETFPAGTLVVNLLGCFLAGLLFHLMHERYALGLAALNVVASNLAGLAMVWAGYTTGKFL